MANGRAWLSLLVMVGVSAGTTTAIAVVSAPMGWTVRSPAWSVLALVAMWSPAFGRFVALRTVDRGFRATMPLRRWGVTGGQVLLWPVVVPLAVYGVAYAIAWYAGLVHWSPGEGRWTTNSQILLNLVVNLVILGVYGTLGALGEEIGWRGYLQPRLDAAGVRYSVVIVSLAWTAFHAPLIVGMAYVDTGSIWRSIGNSAVLDLVLAFIFAHESYRARSVWPAVFFHSFHNTISQWLFPKFFAGGENELWLGEGGRLPMAGYIVVGVALYLWMRRGRGSWQAFAQSALDDVQRSLTSAR